MSQAHSDGGGGVPLWMWQLGQPAPSDWSGPCLFTRLPDDIIHMIIELLRDHEFISYERYRLGVARWDRMTDDFGEAQDGESRSYISQEGPLLNSFQSLAVVNQRLYQICRPLLWNAVTFPTLAPIPVRTWTDLVLRRHGHLIKSLNIRFQLCSKAKTNPAYDNTLVWNSYIESYIEELGEDFGSSREDYEMLETSIQVLSCDSIEQIVSQCPQLHTLNMSGAWVSGEDDPTVLETFLVSLTGRLSDQLRTLKLQFSQGRGREGALSSEGMRQIVQNLPLLTSLQLCGIGLEDEDHESKHLLGSTMGQLKYLSHLSLRRSSSVTPMWRLCSWPQTITNLTIHDCEELWPSFIPHLIDVLAPQITHLDLSIPVPKADSPQSSNFEWPIDYQFTFPRLSHLSLTARNRHSILNSFLSCKNIVVLNYHSIHSEKYASVQTHVLSSAWLRLRSIRLSTDWVQKGPIGPMVSAEPLLEFCKKRGIKLYCLRYGISNGIVEFDPLHLKQYAA